MSGDERHWCFVSDVGEVMVWDCGVYSPDEGGATWFHDRGQAERQVKEGLEKAS